MEQEPPNINVIVTSYSTAGKYLKIADICLIPCSCHHYKDNRVSTFKIIYYMRAECNDFIRI